MKPGPHQLELFAVSDLAGLQAREAATIMVEDVVIEVPSTVVKLVFRAEAMAVLAEHYGCEVEII